MDLERKKTQVVGQFDLFRALRGAKQGAEKWPQRQKVTSGAKAPSFHGTYRREDPGLKSWATSRALSKQLQSHSASSEGLERRRRASSGAGLSDAGYTSRLAMKSGKVSWAMRREFGST